MCLSCTAPTCTLLLMLGSLGRDARSKGHTLVVRHLWRMRSMYMSMHEPSVDMTSSCARGKGYMLQAPYSAVYFAARLSSCSLVPYRGKLSPTRTWRKSRGLVMWWWWYWYNSPGCSSHRGVIGQFRKDNLPTPTPLCWICRQYTDEGWTDSSIPRCFFCILSLSYVLSSGYRQCPCAG